ncbi:MAG: hypothetical protein LC118_17370 [Dehalococcoidia bacterium]|nr:hypothetical protein [Dehalococcoidia bacterium]
MTEFAFVDELPGRPFQAVRSPWRRPRPEAKLLLEFAAALRDRPMTWAMWPREITTATATATTARVRDGFYRQLMPTHGFESVYREGVLYVRFNPERAIDGSVLAFRDGFAAGHKRALDDLGGIIERAFQSARAELRDAKGTVE